MRVLAFHTASQRELKWTKPYCRHNAYQKGTKPQTAPCQCMRDHGEDLALAVDVNEELSTEI
eukprot:1064990-Rhodomonas_salina.1